MGHVEDEITPFLKARRAAIDPAELGLPDGPGRRRVRGLRREEVAQLAGVSVDYYTRIEQGRAPSISDSVLDAIAKALRLTPTEHTYLRNITMPRRHVSAGDCTAGRSRVRQEIHELLAAMDDTVPAKVIGPGADILAWNRLASRLSFDLDALPESELNGARLIFLHPDAKALHPDWHEVAEDTVAGLRADVGRFPENQRVHRVICTLRDVSPEFQRFWAAHDVKERDHGVKRIMHPQVGELVLTFQAFTLPTDPEQRLCTYTAQQGSPSEERLRTLAMATSAVA